MKKASMRVFALLMVVGLMLIPAFSAAAQQGDTTFYLPIVYKPVPAPPVERVGPAGGTFTSVVVDPTNPAVIYVGTFGRGVFKSQDGGQNWQAVNNGLGNLKIQSMAIHPNGTTLYAGTYGSAIYRSTDGGGNWTLINTGLPAIQLIVYDIELDPTNPATVYATMREVGTFEIDRSLNGFAYKSTNGGESWQQIWSGMAMFPVKDPDGVKGDYSYDIDVTPDGQMLYLAVHQHGVYRSPANATPNSWSTSTTGINYLFSRNIAIDPQTPATLYQSVYFKWDGLYKSTNGGNTWGVKKNGLIEPIYGYALTIDPVTPATLYLGTAYDGVYKSTNAADAWSNTGLYSQFIWDLDANGNQVYAGTGGNGLQVSSSGGGNWATLNNGIFGTNVTGLVTFNGVLYAGVNGGGVYASGNQGTSWQPANNGLADMNVQSLLVLTRNSVSNLYALTGTQLFMLSADGSTWSVAVSRNNAPALAPEAPAAEPAVESVEPFNQNSVLPEEEQQLLRIDRTASSDLDSTSSYGTLKQITAAAGFGADLWIGLYHGGVSKSDGSCSNSEYETRTIYALHVSKADGRLYGGIPSADGKTYTVIKNVDCTNWDTLGTDLPNADPLNGFTSNSTRTFAATTTGIYFMLPNGTEWTQTSGYGGVVNAIAVDPANENRLYAATNDGAYYSVDNGANWAPAPQAALQNVIFLSVSVDPGNSNYVYFGSKDGSTYRWDKSIH